MYRWLANAKQSSKPSNYKPEVCLEAHDKKKVFCKMLLKNFIAATLLFHALAKQPIGLLR